MKLKKIFFSILTLCLTAVMLLALVPQQAQAADVPAKNEVWMFPLKAKPDGTKKWKIISHQGRRFSDTGSTFHQGIDITCGVGTTVYAAKSGVVEYASYHANLGYYIRINHGDGTYSQYQHLSQFLVKSGSVAQGEPIAKSGNTGTSSGAHLHFEICMRSDGTPLNSMPLNESAFEGMSYVYPDYCHNPIPAAWLRAWQNFELYKEMGIKDTNSYTAQSLYPYYTTLAGRPAYYAGVVEDKWPPIYLQSRIMYYFDKHAKIELRDRDTYPAFEATAANASGSYKVSVQFMQACLSDLGYSLDVDGFYGPGSTATVQSFQGKYGISQTGNIDKATWDKVIELMHAKYPPLKKLDITDPTTYPTFTTTVPAYVSGTVGYIENVKFVQLCLKDLGYSIDADGHHGPGSTAVVRAFQQENGLTVSGSIDKATWDKLVELMVLKYHECADEDGDHLCELCAEPLSDCGDENGDGICDVCGESVFLAELQGGAILLTNAPENLTVMVAAYDVWGKLLELQVESKPGASVEIAVSGDRIVAFFTVGNGMPIRRSLAVR